MNRRAQGRYISRESRGRWDYLRSENGELKIGEAGRRILNELLGLGLRLAVAYKGFYAYGFVVCGMAMARTERRCGPSNSQKKTDCQVPSWGLPYSVMSVRPGSPFFLRNQGRITRDPILLDNQRNLA